MFIVGKRGFVTGVLFSHERESDEGEPLEPKLEAASTGYESCVETAKRFADGYVCAWTIVVKTTVTRR